MELTTQARRDRARHDCDGDAGDALDLPEAEPICLEALLVHADATCPEHPEDAFLGEFTRWLAACGVSAAERRARIEFAREAIEQLGGLDAPWRALPVGRLLRERGASGERLVELVRFLGESGRLSLHGRQLLLRRLAALHCRDDDTRSVVMHAQTGRPPQLAA